MNPNSEFLTGSALDDLQRFRLLVENAPFCIHELALDGTIRAMNPKGCEMLGLPGFSAVEGKHLSALVAECSLAVAQEAFLKASKGETVDFECDLVTPTGGFLASSHLFPLCDSAGEVQSLFGVSIDISQGAGALEELRKSERRYRQMFETNMAVKFILDPKSGTIVEANSAACEFYGYTAAEMSGMSVFDINVLNPEEIRIEMAEAAKEERLVFEFRHRLKNGEIRDVEVLSGPIDTEEGVRLYSIVHDVTNRKRAERELRKSEERLASAVRGSDDGVWDINLVTGETYWSDRCKALIGFQPNEVDANEHPQFSFLHPDDRERARIAFERHLHKDGAYDLEVRILHAKGNYRWFRTRGEASWDEQGMPIRITGSIRDIHARYEVAERLRRSEERFAFAVAGSKEGIWDWDLPSGEMWWSPRLKELLGYRDSELAASRVKLYSLMHPDDVEQTKEAADNHLETGSEFDVQYRLLTKAKIYRWFRSRGQAVRDEEGAAVRASGVLTDIHDEVMTLERAERRSARIAKQQQSIFALASDPVLATKGLRSACKRINELACEVLGAGRCSVLLMEPGGMNLRSIDLYVAQKREHYSGAVLEAGSLPNFFSALEQSRALVSRNPMQDARFDDLPRSFFTDRKVKAIIQVPVRRAGKLVGLVGISDTQSHRDWHEDEVDFGLDLGQQVARLLDQNDAFEAEQKQRDLERQMLHAQKMESLGLMAGGIAHDFNNLLVAILGNADLLRDSLAIGTKEKALVHEIESASHRAAELCQQMLAYSGHSKHEISRFDLQDLVEEMIQLLHITVPKDATLNFTPGDTLPLIEGDPSQVRQVIMNLILNASESLPHGKGKIHLDIALMKSGCAPAKHGVNVPRAGSYLCLKVRDDGCGMEEETMDRMYDPFFSTKFKGRGLGLASVLGIVRAHQGGIQVESQPGEGTTFRLCLPIAVQQKLPTGKKPTSAENWKGSGLVLMVDDDETVLQLGKEMLSRLGFEVMQAMDGTEALEKFRAHRSELQLVLLDLTMPGLSGEEVYASMQDLDASVPVVMSSGYTEQDVSLRLGERGLRSFLQKPYTLEQLRGKIHGLISGET